MIGGTSLDGLFLEQMLFKWIFSTNDRKTWFFSFDHIFPKAFILFELKSQKVTVVMVYVGLLMGSKTTVIAIRLDF